MMKFVENPNLPVCADIVIIGEKYCKILQNGIKSLGINALFMPDNPYVDPRLSGHADLSVLHLGGNRLLLAPYLKRSSFSQQLEDRGFDIRFADIEQSALYPNDAQMNVCILGNKVIYNPQTGSDAIVKYLTIGNGAIQVSKTAADYGDAEPTFDDMGQISDYALDAVAALYKMGIVNGVSETEFAPLDGATRAQAAKIVYGVLDLIQ